MSWPGISEYNAALHNPSAGLLPEEFKNGTVRRTPFGSPQPISGGFNLIYKFTLRGGRKKAIRCFIQEHPAAQERLPLLLPRIEELRRNNPKIASLFPEIRWIDACVKTAAGTVPAVIMDWVEGKTLGAWLDEHYENPEVIREMREKVLQIGTLFSDLGIAHGDLQGGNILVTPEGKLKVIDYDGLRFFDETDVPAWEAGHPDFQHPDRDRGIPPVYTDRFSALVLDFGLAVTEALPELYREHSTGENLVFLREDYLDPESSAVLQTLTADPRFNRAAEWFTRICLGPPNSVPSLTEFREKAYSEATTETPAVHPSATPLTPSAVTEKETPEKPQKKEKGEREKREYLGPYPVYNGTNYFGISDEEGHRIEVVGRITEVYRGTTKYGKPYAFISFDDWREDSFRVVIWSEGLETFKEKPGRSWEGRWISIMGLVDEPYVKHYRGEETIYYSITVHDSSQLHELTTEQAAYRLGRKEKTGTPKAGETGKACNEGIYREGRSPSWQAAEKENTRLLREMQGHTSSPPHATPVAPSAVSNHSKQLEDLPSNQELLEQLKSGASSSTPENTTPSSSPIKEKKESNSGCWVIWIFIGIGVVFLLVAVL